MYISMYHLEQLCGTLEHRFLRAKTRYGLTGWAMLEHAPIPFNVHLVYIAEYGIDLSSFPLPDGMHLILFAAEDTDLNTAAASLPGDHNILLIACNDRNPFLLSLQEYFDHVLATGLFSQSLLEIMSYEGGIQGMVNHAFQILENPIFVFDSTFTLIAANWEEAEKYEAAKNIIKNKGFSDSEFQLANRNHIHKKMLTSEKPLLVHHEELGFDQLITSIAADRDVGHIVVCAFQRPFNKMDENSLWVLKKFIDQQIKKDEFVRNSRGFHYENFLKDLLDEKIATNQMFLDRMQYVGVTFPDIMCCVVVELARTSGAINPYRIRNLFEGQFSDIKTILYNGQIVILFHTPTGQIPDHSLPDQIRQICAEQNLYAGMSNWFEDILKISGYYKQALRAIELGISSHNHAGLFLYQDYYLDHVKNIFMQKESAEIFCHPRMKLLLDYDHKHGTELSYTLYMYLYHERNMGAAAEAMGMHRSSLTYRFKKIHSLIGDDFDDIRERNYLILSYELNKTVNKE